MTSTTRKTAFPDTTTVIALSRELVRMGKEIVEDLDRYAGKIAESAAGAEVTLSQRIRRIADTARIVRLRSIDIVCQDTADLMRRIETGELAGDAQETVVLRTALASILRYLGAAAEGHIGSGLVLYPAYTEVVRKLPGRAPLTQGEMFLPVTPMYRSVSPTYNEQRFIAEIARYYDEYKNARLSYPQTRDVGAINRMRTALATMETKNPPPNFQTYLSLAICFMDIAMRASGEEPIAAEDEVLLTHIDSELAGIVQGELECDEKTISWFLFRLAQAPKFSNRGRAFLGHV